MPIPKLTDRIDQEISDRRIAISRAERSIAEAKRAAYISEHTRKALAKLESVVAVDRIALAQLEDYRDGLVKAG
jgi:hypothetical protein